MIERIKIGLLSSIEETEEGKKNYNLLASASFDMKKWREGANIGSDEEILDTIFGDLVRSSEASFDSVGLWIEANGKEYSNSISLSDLEGIEKFGIPGISPIGEFLKMTIQDEV